MEGNGLRHARMGEAESYELKANCPTSTTFSATIIPTVVQPAKRTRPLLTNSPITSFRFVKSSSGTSAKGSVKLRTTCDSHQDLERVEPDRDHRQRRNDRNQPTQEDGELDVQKALDDHLPRQDAHGGRRQPRTQQRHGKDHRCRRSKQRPQRVIGVLDGRRFQARCAPAREPPR